eukprot:c52577_g1_i1.p1 GENE.c52577_g1_i1~~c52577_g1_i1.p1  ORF type:complete len:315 (+),score=58.32 c52577_g1_i1:31-975(+)
MPRVWAVLWLCLRCGLAQQSNFTSSNVTQTDEVTAGFAPFEKTFIINMDRSQEKWNYIHQRLLRAGWPHERFSAVDGIAKFGDGLDGVMSCSKLTHAVHLMSAGERGHFETFRLLFESIVKQNISMAMVIEDDQDFVDEPAKQSSVLRKYMSQLATTDPEWDLVWFAWKPISEQFRALYRDPFLDAPNLPEDRQLTENLWQLGPNYGTWAFAVSFSGAKKILSFMNHQFASTDYQMARLNAAYPRTFKDPCTFEETSLPKFSSYGFKPMMFKARLGSLLSLVTSDIGWLREFVHHKQNPVCEELQARARASHSA